MNKIATIAFAVLCLAGCASTKPIYTADGRRGTILTCSGWARNWGMCEQKAGDICGARGYVVTNKHEEVVEIGMFHEQAPIRQLTIICN